MSGYQTISGDIKIAAGDSCVIKTPLVDGRCWHYKGRACGIFNKVIVDGKKCPPCLEASK
jgi:hypothetical protein